MTNMASARQKEARERTHSALTSDVARTLARWGRVLYWSGVVIIIPILSMAILFALLDNERLFQRVVSVLVMGVFPALLIWCSGLITCSIFKVASVVYDSAATALRRTVGDSSGNSSRR
jgi:hypothetical protein